MNEKIIMISEDRYNKMLDTYDKAMEELEALRNELEAIKAGKGAN